MLPLRRLKGWLKAGTVAVSGFAIALIGPGTNAALGQVNRDRDAQGAEWQAVPGLQSEADVERALRDYLAQATDATVSGESFDLQLLAQAGAVTPAQVTTAAQLLEQTLGMPIAAAAPEQVAGAIAQILQSLGPNAPSLDAFTAAMIAAGASPAAVTTMQSAYASVLSELVTAGIIPPDVAGMMLSAAGALPGDDIYG